MEKIIFLATFHNRKKKTLRCIDSLIKATKYVDNNFKIVLVDDGSTDKTTDDLLALYKNIEIIKGDGNLYWCGGMIKGWNYIKNLDFNYLFVFNDDVLFYDNSIKLMLSEIADRNNCIISGMFCDPISKKITYGGYNLGKKLYPLKLRRVNYLKKDNILDTCNMNAVLIPKSFITKHGFLSTIFKHSMADIEFGLRLREVGIRVLLTSDVVGECSRNLSDGTSSEEKLSIVEKIRRFNSIKEQPFSPRWFLYKNYGGPFWFISFWFVYIKMILF